MFDSMKYNKSCLSTKNNKTKQVSTRRRRADRESPSPSARRVLSFSQTVAIYPFPSRLDMSEEDMNDVWYNEVEFRDMKRACVQVIRKMIAGALPHDDDNDNDDQEGEIETTRGLETKTPKGSDVRRKNRYAALFAVLDEQDRQRDDYREPDSNYIAQLYHQSSAHCQMKAFLVAEEDAKIVHDSKQQDETKKIGNADANKGVTGSSANDNPNTTTATTTTATTISSDDKLPKKVSPSYLSPTVRRPTLKYIASPHSARSRRCILTLMN